MGNIVNKIVSLIKEAKKEIDPKLKAWIEKRYGPWDERDFVNDELDTYFKTDQDHKTEGGGISHTIIRLPSFSELIKQLKDSRDAANDLIRGESVRDDEVLRNIYANQKDIFNTFRTHLRKEYPAFYSQLKGQLTEEELAELEEMSTTGGGAGAASFTPGTGMAYATPYAFRLSGSKANDKAYTEIGYKTVKENVGADLGPGPKASGDGVKDNAYVKNYGYKLVPSKIKGSGLEVKQLFEDTSVSDFQQERIMAFDLIEQQLNDIYKTLSNAKNETADYYSENPASYAVVKPTDLVLDYIKDIKDLLKGE